MTTLYINYPSVIANSVASGAYPLLAPDGSVSAPSYSFTNSATSGMYSPSVNALAFSTNGIIAISISNTQAVTFSNQIIYAVNQVASTATILALASTTSAVEITGSTNTDLHGIAAGVAGQRLTIFFVGMGTLTVKQNSGSATGVNRIQCPGAADLVMSGGAAQAVEFMYRASSAQWVVIGRSA